MILVTQTPNTLYCAPSSDPNITNNCIVPSLIDFFRSLGRLSWPVIEKHWYGDGGKISPLIKFIKKDESRWREKYWEHFSKICNIKLKEWKYENEQRLVLSSSISELNEKSDRLLHFNFSSLDGIIFGIKTPREAKYKILKIILDKCQKEKRTDFNFYQSIYNPKNGKIEARKLNSFNITLDNENNEKEGANS